VTYHLPDEFRPFIKIGSSVKVPWGKETIIGIVANIAPEIPHEGVLKSVEGPHCTIPLLSASEIALIAQLARYMFVRIHTIAQLFLPLGIFDALEDKNFLELTPPCNLTTQGLIADFIIAPDPETIIAYFKKILPEMP
jgi:primosomal protein N'